MSGRCWHGPVPIDRLLGLGLSVLKRNAQTHMSDARCQMKSTADSWQLHRHRQRGFSGPTSHMHGTRMACTDHTPRLAPPVVALQQTSQQQVESSKLRLQGTWRAQ
jgi:hypothetical protein